MLPVTCYQYCVQRKYYNILNQKQIFKCVDAQFKLSIAFFQFLVYALIKNKFTFQKDKQNESLVSVAFIPFHISKDFTVKIEKGKFNIFNKNPITVEAMNTFKLNLDLIIGFAGRLGDLDLKIPELTLLNSPIFNAKLFEMPFTLLCNLNETSIQIPEDTLIFSCELANKADQIILNKVNKDILKQSQIQLTSYDNFEQLDNLANVVSKFMSCYAKIDHKPPVTQMSKDDTMYTASEGLVYLAYRANALWVKWLQKWPKVKK